MHPKSKQWCRTGLLWAPEYAPLKVQFTSFLSKWKQNLRQKKARNSENEVSPAPENLQLRVTSNQSSLKNLDSMVYKICVFVNLWYINPFFVEQT